MPFKDPADKRRYQQKYFREYYSNPEKREIIKIKVRQRKRELREWFTDYKRTLICVDCGITGKENPWAMEFHHTHPENKRDLVSYMVAQGYAKKRIMEEVAKCKVVCANCHRKHHYEESKENGTSVFQDVGGRPERDDDTYTSARERRSRQRFREQKRKWRSQDKDEEAADSDLG